MTWPLYVLLGVNAGAFALMGADKFRAGRNRRRISEKALFLLPILGGALGGTLGMYAFHHKTRKRYFAWGFPLLAAVQLLALIYARKVGILP